VQCQSVQRGGTWRASGTSTATPQRLLLSPCRRLERYRLESARGPDALGTDHETSGPSINHRRPLIAATSSRRPGSWSLMIRGIPTARHTRRSRGTLERAAQRNAPLEELEVNFESRALVDRARKIFCTCRGRTPSEMISSARLRTRKQDHCRQRDEHRARRRAPLRTPFFEVVHRLAEVVSNALESRRQVMPSTNDDTSVRKTKHAIVQIVALSRR